MSIAGSRRIFFAADAAVGDDVFVKRDLVISEYLLPLFMTVANPGKAMLYTGHRQ